MSKKFVVVALWVDTKVHSASSSIVGIYKSKKKARKAADIAEKGFEDSEQGFMKFDHVEIKRIK